MAFIRANGIVLHHQVVGRPKTRRALVFINSLGSDFRIWQEVVPAFATATGSCSTTSAATACPMRRPRPTRSTSTRTIFSALLDHLDDRRTAARRRPLGRRHDRPARRGRRARIACRGARPLRHGRQDRNAADLGRAHRRGRAAAASTRRRRRSCSAGSRPAFRERRAGSIAPAGATCSSARPRTAMPAPAPRSAMPI